MGVISISYPEGETGQRTDQTIQQMEDAYDVLANARRRKLLEILNSHGESIEVSKLAGLIAAWENNSSVDEISCREQKIVYTALTQRHLPRLERMNVVDYDKRHQTVRKTEKVNIVLQHSTPRPVPTHHWEIYYLLGGILASVIIANTLLGIFPVFDILIPIMNVVVIAIFTLISIAYAYSDSSIF
ncbi:hypothetical protein [Haladaptatus sp. CMAA 1911]|uniref:DUF7344 domain-containing protein n=1 Tax=unclassified Haladaptatus TaxID=2622732 RepID=UPI00375531BA